MGNSATAVAELLYNPASSDSMAWPDPKGPGNAASDALEFCTRFAAIAGDARLLYGEGRGVVSGAGFRHPQATVFTDRFILRHDGNETRILPWDRLSNVKIASGQHSGDVWESLSVVLGFDGEQLAFADPGSSKRPGLADLLDFALTQLAARTAGLPGR